MMDGLIKSESEHGDLLTDDEKLLRKPRWQGETRDVRTALINIFLLHGVTTAEVIYEDEPWIESLDDVVLLISQLSEGARSE